MQSPDTTWTIGQIVTQRPYLSRVFEKLGLDYCCGGARTLSKACAEHGLDLKTVSETLEATEANRSAPSVEVDYSAMTMTELADHIETTHHVYLRNELPRLERMVQKVAVAHEHNHPQTRELANNFSDMKMELEQHMIKEEQILFPAIRALESADQAMQFSCGSVANPIEVMEQEHENAGNALYRMHELTNNYTAPDDACNTYRAMLDGLRELEADLHQHIHKENNILFPGAIKYECATKSGNA
jgi:regulator of cell morphogenesis and NO signaling